MQVVFRLARSSWNLPAISTQSIVNAVQRLMLRIVHRGVHPDFRRASRDLYFDELRNQMESVTHFILHSSHSPVVSKIQLLRQLRSERMIRYTRYHWLELNQAHPELLQLIYARVDTIRNIQRAICTLKSSKSIIALLENVNEFHSFRLLNQLGKEGLKPEST